MFYIFDGDDEFTRQEALTALKTGLGPSDMMSLNTSVLDGARVGFDELRHACDSVPFFTDARVVVVTGLISRLQGSPRKKPDSADDTDTAPAGDPAAGSNKAYRDQLLEYLPSLPETTHLVLVEPALIPGSSPFLKLLEAHPGKGQRKPFPLPNLRRAQGRAELQDWVRARAKAKGSKIQPDAVNALMNLIGNDLRQMDSELEKLAVYCHGRAIAAADVQELVPLAREAVVWDLVDAIARKQTKPALNTLRRLIDEGEPPLRIFGLIVREYRLMVQTKMLGDQRRSEDQLAAALGVQPWIARQRMEAVRTTTAESLKATYRMLLEVDVEIKTGVQEPEAALEFLIAALCR